MGKWKKIAQGEEQKHRNNKLLLLQSISLDSLRRITLTQRERERGERERKREREEREERERRERELSDNF